MVSSKQNAGIDCIAAASRYCRLYLLCRDLRLVRSILEYSQPNTRTWTLWI